MKEIIEIVIEKVQLEKTVELLLKMVSSSTLKDYQVSTDSSEIEINFQSHEKVFNEIDQSSDGSFYFNFLVFNFKDLLLSDVGLQIYKYNNDYDLNLHIDEKEISSKVLISNLQKWVKSLAEELEAEDFFCGYEPAMDKETRFFSGSALGPLEGW